MSYFYSRLQRFARFHDPPVVDRLPYFFFDNTINNNYMQKAKAQMKQYTILVKKRTNCITTLIKTLKQLATKTKIMEIQISGLLQKEMDFYIIPNFNNFALVDSHPFEKTKIPEITPNVKKENQQLLQLLDQQIEDHPIQFQLPQNISNITQSEVFMNLLNLQLIEFRTGKAYFNKKNPEIVICKNFETQKRVEQFFAKKFFEVSKRSYKDVMSIFNNYGVFLIEVNNNKGCCIYSLERRFGNVVLEPLKHKEQRQYINFRNTFISQPSRNASSINQSQKYFNLDIQDRHPLKIYESNQKGKKIYKNIFINSQGNFDKVIFGYLREFRNKIIVFKRQNKILSEKITIKQQLNVKNKHNQKKKGHHILLIYKNKEFDKLYQLIQEDLKIIKLKINRPKLKLQLPKMHSSKTIKLIKFLESTYFCHFNLMKNTIRILEKYMNPLQQLLYGEINLEKNINNILYSNQIIQINPQKSVQQESNQSIPPKIYFKILTKEFEKLKIQKKIDFVYNFTTQPLSNILLIEISHITLDEFIKIKQLAQNVVGWTQTRQIEIEKWKFQNFINIYQNHQKNINKTSSLQIVVKDLSKSKKSGQDLSLKILEKGKNCEIILLQLTADRQKSEKGLITINIGQKMIKSNFDFFDDDQENIDSDKYISNILKNQFIKKYKKPQINPKKKQKNILPEQIKILIKYPQGIISKENILSLIDQIICNSKNTQNNLVISLYLLNYLSIYYQLKLHFSRQVNKIKGRNVLNYDIKKPLEPEKTQYFQQIKVYGFSEELNSFMSKLDALQKFTRPFILTQYKQKFKIQQSIESKYKFKAMKNIAKQYGCQLNIIQNKNLMFSFHDPFKFNQLLTKSINLLSFQ